jgi:hypothetical protein
MQRLTLVTAALLVGAITMAGTPALAELNYGPVKNGNQCYKTANNFGEMSFGHWEPCAGSAAPAAGKATHHRANHS